MRIHRTLAAGIACAALLATAPSAPAQPDDQARVDVDFPGGTVAEFIEHVQQAAGPRRIVVGEGLDAIPVPPVELDNVSVYSALQAITLTNADRDIDVGFVDEVMYVRVRRTPETPPERGPFHNQRQDDHILTRSIAEFIEGEHAIDVDHALGAIEVALDVAGDPQSVVVRFHEDTGILVARGPIKKLEVIDDVIHALTESAHHHAAIRELAEENQELRGHLRHLVRRLEELGILREIGLHIDEDELQDLLYHDDHDDDEHHGEDDD